MLAAMGMWFPAALALMALSVVFGAVLRMRQSARIRKALAEEPEDDRCVGCGGRSIDTLGIDAFHCRACGFQWGAGLAALRNEARRQAVERMAPAERRAGGTADLKAAQLALLAAKGHVDQALQISEQGGVSRQGDTYDDDKQQALVVAVGEAKRAHLSIEQARLKLGTERIGITLGDLDVDLGSIGFAVDSVGGLGDSAVHEEIVRAEEHISRVLQQVELALARLA